MADSDKTPFMNWNRAKDILVILIIPLVGWLIKLEVGNAERDLLIAQLQKDVQEAQDIDESVQANALKLVSLEGKLDTANAVLGEIKDLVKERD